MKIGLCLLAFIAGMFVTVRISDVETPAVGEATTSQVDPPQAEVREMDVKERSFGQTSDGQEVTQFVCTNANGLTLEMIDYGATVTAIRVPDRKGKLENITLGFDSMDGYQKCTSYFGCTVGRYCNRIAGGSFSIDGTTFKLATNNGDNHLHGGMAGFDKKMWSASPVQTDDHVGVKFTLSSPDGDEGYPGNLKVQATYLLNNDDELLIELRATTDKPTHVNLTNHNYWNLAGAGADKILDHQLKIEAERYIPVDAAGIPTGQLAKVENTPFDFRKWHSIGERVDQVEADPVGYDHCFALRSQSGEMALCASVKDAKSGRIMEIWTTQPGVQFYTGNFLDGSDGSGGFKQHTAFCLETQRYPDAPNQAGFPSTLLEPGDVYLEKTIHKFKVAK